MKAKSNHILFYIAFGVVLYAGLMNLSLVLLFLQKILDLVFPILLGLILAFMLSVPMRGFEKILKRVMSQSAYERKSGMVRALSLALTLLCIILVLGLAFIIAIPALTESVRSIVPLVKEKWPEWVSYLNGYHIDLTRAAEWIQSSDWAELTSGANTLWDSAVNAAASTVSVITNSIFAIVIAIYVLVSKHILAGQVKKLMNAYLEAGTVKQICSVSNLACSVYGKFLSGQCMESIILGGLIFTAFSLFRLPYAGLIGLLTSLFAFVPYVGAFASCLIGTFLILLAAPSKVILCVVVYMAVQFVENQFIYPHVVGTSVGLSPLWTLIAALLGGKLFGLPGIVFFIPIVAVLYSLVRENTNLRLQSRRGREHEL